MHIRLGILRPLTMAAFVAISLLHATAATEAEAYVLPLRPLAVVAPVLPDDADAQAWLRQRVWPQVSALARRVPGLARWLPEEARDCVAWTLEESRRVSTVASTWGLPLSHLLALNPDLRPDATVEAGVRLTVHCRDPLLPSQSIGRPTSGRLLNAVPMPEGEGWMLRPYRQRAWGTALTVDALVEALRAYHARYPQALPVRVGEISSRQGGRLKPHRSHCSGRDVDFGYVPLDEPKHPFRMPRVYPETMDVEKTWFLLQALLATGQVQSMYVDRSLQMVLAAEARRHLPLEEVQAIFSYPRHAASRSAIIQHWPGHADHVHARFRCEPDNVRCRQH